jgi:hypothetical protein
VNHTPGGLVAVVVSLATLAIAAPAQASAATQPKPRPSLAALTDLAEGDQALERGELSVELLVVGAGIALVIGVLLAVVVATLLDRRGSVVPTSGSAGETAVEDGRPSVPASRWPLEDRDAYRSGQTSNDLRASLAAIGATSFTSGAALDAQAETEPLTIPRPSEEPTFDTRPTVIHSSGSAIPPSGVTSPAGDGSEARGPIDLFQERTGIEPPERQAASGGSGELSQVWNLPRSVSTRDILPIEMRASAEPNRAPGHLGTSTSQLVVELREAPGTPGVGSSLPFVAAIGTVAAGVSFAGGALIGATLGVGVGAAIGLAFAGGAGVAVGATVALVAGRRA